ncbi:MAG: hypothetical protein HDR33_00760 [Treponema sp.]|nr:hypothetical protein [Treponema sp.]
MQFRQRRLKSYFPNKSACEPVCVSSSTSTSSFFKAHFLLHYKIAFL